MVPRRERPALPQRKDIYQGWQKPQQVAINNKWGNWRQVHDYAEVGFSDQRPMRRIHTAQLAAAAAATDSSCREGPDSRRSGTHGCTAEDATQPRYRIRGVMGGRQGKWGGWKNNIGRARSVWSGGRYHGGGDCTTGSCGSPGHTKSDVPHMLLRPNACFHRLESITCTHESGDGDVPYRTRTSPCSGERGCPQGHRLLGRPRLSTRRWG